MVTNVLDWLPTEDELDRLLCVNSRQVTLIRRLMTVARLADQMRVADEADRSALEHSGRWRSQQQTGQRR